MPILEGPESEISKSLTEVEKTIGVDLKLTPENDLELDNKKDFKLVFGGQNAAQAVRVRVFIEPGGLIFHPAIGTALQIGEKTQSAFDIQIQLIRSLSQDPRFERVRAKVSILGNVVFVDLQVGIVNTGIAVPLRFAVTR